MGLTRVGLASIEEIPSGDWSSAARSCLREPEETLTESDLERCLPAFALFKATGTLDIALMKLLHKLNSKPSDLIGT